MKIQTSIAGFSGQPATILGLLDEDTGVLVIAKSAAFSEAKMEGFALVSNLDLDEVDYKFDDKSMRDAIRAFFNGLSQGTIDIVETVQRFDPSHRIERQGVDESGPKYAVSPDVDNGQIAVLAMVSYANKQKDIGSAISAADELAELFGVVTI